MGYVTPEFAEIGQNVNVLIMGEMWPAIVVEDSPYDPKNEKIRIDG